MKNILDIIKRKFDSDDSPEELDYAEKTKPVSPKSDEPKDKSSSDHVSESKATEKKDDIMEKKKTGWQTPKKYSNFFAPRIVNKKLTIILMENTPQSDAVKNIILKIIHRIPDSELVCVINYGSKVKVGRICKVKNFDDKKLLNSEDLKDDAFCLYDAIYTLNKVIKVAMKEARYESFGIDQYKITSIDVIGIGSGLDAASKTTREEAQKYFDDILLNSGVETKYFCFSEDTFKDVALLGFRSIGAFPSNSLKKV